MIDKITVEDPGFGWDWWLYTAVGIGGLILIAGVIWILSFAMSTRAGTRLARKIAGWVLISAAIAIPAGALVNTTVSNVVRNNTISADKDQQLRELGYLNIEEEDGYYQYTAIKDNQYVRFVMVEYPTLTWQIMVLDMSTEER